MNDARIISIEPSDTEHLIRPIPDGERIGVLGRRLERDGEAISEKCLHLALADRQRNAVRLNDSDRS